MKLTTNLVLMAALVSIAAAPAGAMSINFYTSGGFTSCTGCTTSTVAPPFGDSYPNNQISYTNGTSTINLTYADLATALNPALVTAPTLVSFGTFNASDSGAGGTVTIGAFSFNLVVHDLTDGGTTTFVGSSTGGTMAHNQSTVIVSWSPLSGSVGNSLFGIFTPTQIVPTTTTNGEVTIQGQVTNTTPEPASMALLGGGLIALGLASRRKIKHTR